MNTQTKFFTIIASCMLILFGIMASPKITEADAANTVTSSEINTTAIITNNATNNKDNVNIYTDNSNSFVHGNYGPFTLSNITAYCMCQKQHTKPVPSPAPTTPQPTNNNVPVSSSSSSNSLSSSPGSGSSFYGAGSIVGVSIKNLPVTSSYWFFIAFIGNILMMLLGGYLRLRSGRSPGYAYAV